MASTSTRTLRLVAASLVGLTLACGEGDPTGLDDGTPGVLDSTIPPIPVPTSAMPVTQSQTDVGTMIQQKALPRASKVTMVGRFSQTLRADAGAPFNTSVDWNGFTPLWADEFEDFQRWIALTGGSYECVNADTTLAFDPNEVIEARRECVTFHHFELDQAVEIQEYRYWLNVGSRVLGPGTSNSVTVTWTEGVDSTSGFQFSSTQGVTRVDETNWQNCTSWEANGGFSIGGFSGGASGGGSECFGGRQAAETSNILSETFEESRTVSTETSRSETTSVAGGDGADRVYTVWQLVDRYVYSSPNGSPVDPETFSSDPGWTMGVGATEAPAFTQEEIDAIPEDHDGASFYFPSWSYFPEGTARAEVEWTPLGVQWLDDGILDVKTNLFFQHTRDFPNGG